MRGDQLEWRREEPGLVAAAEARAAQAESAHQAALSELSRMRGDLDHTAEAARKEAARLGAEIARVESAAARAAEDALALREEMVAGIRARAEGELAGERARVQALSELAEARRHEIAQLTEQLRAALSPKPQPRQRARTTAKRPVGQKEEPIK